jgi:hypothetical protein
MRGGGTGIGLFLLALTPILSNLPITAEISCAAIDSESADLCAQAVPSSVHLEKDHVDVPRFTPFFQPLPCLVIVTQGDVNER